MVELSPRLEQIGRMVAQGSVVADIGTDHGQLMAWLGERGILRAGYACDINKKPLDKARRILAELGLSDTVACVQAPGLEGLEPGSADTVVIAGMGGDLIARILDEAPWVREHRARLLLQPMTKAELLRAYLAEHGYCFLDERLVCENHTYFPVMLVRGGGVPEALNPARCWGGVLLERDPLQGKALEAMIAQMGRALAGLERSALTRNAEKAAQLRPLIAQLQQMKEEWAHADHKRN